MTNHILHPAPEQFKIDQPILMELLQEAEPDLQERPECWTRATAAIVQPSLELLLSGFLQAWQISPRSRYAAVSILNDLANGQEPTGKIRRPHLRKMIEGYKMAIRTTTGAAAVRLFASNMLGAL